MVYKQFLQHVMNFENVIVYGCGEVGKKIGYFLIRSGVNIKAFSVTGTSQITDLFGVPIIKIDDVKLNNNTVVIIATKKVFQNEIREKLNSLKNLATRIFVSEELLESIDEWKRELYKNAKHERATYIQYKDDFDLTQIDVRERYNSLIDGLDEKDIHLIDRILQRLNIILRSEKNEFDFYDDYEKYQMQQVEKYFWNKITYDNGVYNYGNYKLLSKYFDPLVFFNKYNIFSFGSINKITKGNIIDGGAFVGDSSLMFAQLTEGQVYAIEPMLDNCNEIKNNMCINSVNNIFVVNKALGENCGQVMIRKNTEQLNWSTMVPCDAREYESDYVEMTSIDSFVDENQLDVSLIKLHVEGNEYNTIRGAVKTILKQKPSLLIHIHHTPVDFFEIKTFLESLDAGYKFRIYKPFNGNICTGTILMADVMGINE